MLQHYSLYQSVCNTSDSISLVKYLITLHLQGGKQWIYTTMATRRKKIEQHFDDLEEAYFSIRQRDSGEFSSRSWSCSNIIGNVF